MTSTSRGQKINQNTFPFNLHYISLKLIYQNIWCHDIAEMLLKFALNINQSIKQQNFWISDFRAHWFQIENLTTKKGEKSTLYDNFNNKLMNNKSFLYVLLQQGQCWNG
jgi:hypothetical protein